jgi:hypothetical protein
MGYSSWTPVASSNYAVLESNRALRSHSAHTVDIQEGRVEARVHKAMDPKGVRRESRDSAAHPQSLAIGVMFDQTGSMGQIPRELQRRLVSLMTLLTSNNYATDPQVLFGAIGDATCDIGPLQVGQFEAGLEIDQDLERIWVEHKGGGQTQESYELAPYFFSRHVVADCWEKRQKKGYLFTMGDESAYPAVSRIQVARLMGDTIQTDIPTADIVAECQSKWNYFHLLVETETLRSKASIAEGWRKLLPDGHVIELKDPSNVATIIGLVVGLSEGRVSNPKADLAQLGADASSINAVLKSLHKFAGTRGIKLTD